MIGSAIEDLLVYGVAQRLMEPDDVAYCRNRLLEVLRIQDFVPGPNTGAGLDEVLKVLVDDVAARGLMAADVASQRDLWDTAIMGCLVAPPSDVVADFEIAYATDPVAATDRFHHVGVASNYIRVGRTDRNITWRQPTRYGPMDMTINLSKPEKDPQEIALAAQGGGGDYPRCLLCRENEGYPGRIDHPARQNLRLIPVQLGGETWYLQYSPYRYYNEHCIVLSEEHRPMRISDQTFVRLAEFTSWLPHYIVGSNADLPIVGGSILSHDHFQGGRYRFAMDRAGVLTTERRNGVTVSVLDWPLAVLRVQGPDADVIDFSTDVLDAWRGYDDPARGIVSHTQGVPHNTLAPIARRVDGVLRMDLVLRNNRTDQQHPHGIFHPHTEVHPVKKENIGLIEVMGLAVLPGRLADELRDVSQALVSGAELPERSRHHQPMLDGMRATGETNVRQAAGEYFVRGLEHCGVFAGDPVAGFQAFLESM